MAGTGVYGYVRVGIWDLGAFGFGRGSASELVA